MVPASYCRRHAVLNDRSDGEEAVAVLIDKGAPAIASIFSVLKAGKIVVPLDPHRPHASLA